MSVNDHRPHLLVIPEDDANRQLANGFELEVWHSRRIQILPEAGGWTHVCDDFRVNHLRSMKKLSNRHLLLLLDFDDRSDRRSHIEKIIPPELKDRVFLLGVRSEPEALKRAGFGSFETIGRRLASECRDKSSELWRHELLIENSAELIRLAACRIELPIPDHPG